MEAAKRHAARAPWDIEAIYIRPRGFAQHASRSRRVGLDPTGAEPGGVPSEEVYGSAAASRSKQGSSVGCIHTHTLEAIPVAAPQLSNRPSTQPQSGDCRVPPSSSHWSSSWQFPRVIRILTKPSTACLFSTTVLLNIELPAVSSPPISVCLPCYASPGVGAGPLLSSSSFPPSLFTQWLPQKGPGDSGPTDYCPLRAALLQCIPALRPYPLRPVPRPSTRLL
jgi:hypothetical protein